MGLLLSVLITCVGVLEVIACYTHFRIGVAYAECKSNIRDIAKYYALELRKHELHFETGPGDPETSHQETLSELIHKRALKAQAQQRTNGHVQSGSSSLDSSACKNTVRVQENTQQYSNGNIISITASCSESPNQGTPNIALNLKVPRNSISGLDSPTVQNLISPDVNITEAIVEIQNHEHDESFWTRKSPSPYPDKIGLEVVERDFWRSRSTSPFPESKDSDSGVELIYTPGLRKHRTASPLLETPDMPNNLHRSPSGSELVDKDFWKKHSLPSPNLIDDNSAYSKTDLEVQNITESIIKPSVYPEMLFGIADDNEETKFDEEFLRSLDGVKSSKCDDRRRSFRKKRNSSSTSSKASRDEVRSITSCDEIDGELNKRQLDDNQTNKITPLTEEDTEGHLEFVTKRDENIVLERCESTSSIPLESIIRNKEEAKVINQEQTRFQAKVSPNTSHQENADTDKGKPNLSFTEKVKDLEISVQLLVTVKGTSQGDKMEYTTTVSQDDKKTPVKVTEEKDINEVTKSNEEKSEFGKVKTSVTYGNSTILPTKEETKLKDLQISSQSLIHAERTVQDDVKSSEAEFLKLYESYSELPDTEKNKFLKIIGHSKKTPQDEITKSDTPHIEQMNSENISEPLNKERVSITEITEIIESVESITTIPPEKTADNIKKSEIISPPDQSEQRTEISDMKYDNKIDNINQIVSSPQEFQQSRAIENKNISNLEHLSLISNQSKIDDQSNIVNEITPENVSDNTVTEIINIEDFTVQLEKQNDIVTNEPNQSISNIDNTKTNCNLTNVATLQNIIKDKFVILENTHDPKIQEKIETDTNLEKHQLDIEKYPATIITEETNETKQKQVTIEGTSTTELETLDAVSVTNDDHQETKTTNFVLDETNESSNIIEIEKTNLEVPKADSSSESSSTPSTVIENTMRRASKTVFEEATPAQNQEVIKRKFSNSEISSKQASQAFWLIFSAEYANAMEKDWHGQHFSCWQCDESLTGQRYVLRDDHPYCVKCYEQVFANPCEKCNKIIGIDSKDLSYKDKHWHEACFQCTTCSESLVDKQFGAKGEKIYCGNCYDKQFASRCDGCGKIFHAGTKKMEYKNRQWHEQCFKCCKCETPIGTKSFIPREKDIYCAGCYEEKFATRCVKCNKAIQSGGVTYKNEPWHRECFTCTHCNKNLAGQRFTSRDDKPCCAECFGRLFAKRCTSCNEPITGIGGTRFISFEDRHWHNDCFICANCSTSLVGRGFITDEDKIICPECAKERFM